MRSLGTLKKPRAVNITSTVIFKTDAVSDLSLCLCLLQGEDEGILAVARSGKSLCTTSNSEEDVAIDFNLSFCDESRLFYVPTFGDPFEAGSAVLVFLFWWDA